MATSAAPSPATNPIMASHGPIRTSRSTAPTLRTSNLSPQSAIIQGTAKASQARKEAFDIKPSSADAFGVTLKLSVELIEETAIRSESSRTLVIKNKPAQQIGSYNTSIYPR